MNRAQLAKALSRERRISLPEAEEIVDSMVLVMGRTLASGESIVLSNFGTLKPVCRTPRSFGPRAHDRAIRPDRFQVDFRAADRLLEAVRAGDDQVTFRKRRRELPRAS